MNKTEKILFDLIASALVTDSKNGGTSSGECQNKRAEIHLTEMEWENLLGTSLAQMVGAIAFHELKKRKHNMPDSLARQWEDASDFSQGRFYAQVLALSHLSVILNCENIRTMVLKGMGLALLYPTPQLRECVDVDIYCFDDYERVNAIAAANGFNPTDAIGEIMHDSFVVDGIHIENHHQFSNEYYDAEKMLGETLMELTREAPLTDPRMPDLLFPSPTMGALHMISHTLAHLVESGINMRHLADWTQYVRAHQDDTDWKFVLSKIDEAGMTGATVIITEICRRHMGLEKGIPGLDMGKLNEKDYRKVLHSIFHPYLPSELTSNPIKKLHRKIKQHLRRSSMSSIVYGEGFRLSFIDSFVFLRKLKKDS